MTHKRRTNSTPEVVFWVDFLLIVVLHLAADAVLVKQGRFVKTDRIDSAAVVLSGQASTANHCAQRCLSDEGCKGLMYSRDTKECRLVADGSSVVVNLTGWKMYLKKQPIDVCDTVGPEYNKTSAGCFYYNATEMLWTDARAFCEGLGAHVHLATADNQEKIDAIVGLTDSSGHIWVGARDLYGNFTFAWVADGAALSAVSPLWRGADPKAGKPYVAIMIGWSVLITPRATNTNPCVCQAFPGPV